MDLGSSFVFVYTKYIYIYPCLASYLYLDDFTDSLNLQHVSWVGLCLPKAFQQDGQNDCCRGEICDPPVPGQPNHKANMPFKMYDLPLITFKLFKYAFIPALNKERCTVYHSISSPDTVPVLCLILFIFMN